MAENTVILEFIGDTSGLKPAVDALNVIGDISDEQAAAFKKANDEANKMLQSRTNATKRLASEEKKLVDANKQSAKGIQELNKGVKEINQTLATGVIGEAAKGMKELGGQMGGTLEKSKSLKAQLKELKAELAAMELAGDDSSQTFIDMAVAAARLEDQIGDTNFRIRQLASDTRTFDLVVEGVRGMTAAFSVAQGAAALFGEENEDVQKALLKVQAAMALATGAQELANIATAKGGIATKAYGAALTVVEVIQKRFAVSSAAAWAIATGGITLLLAGLAALYVAYQNNADAAEDLEAKEAARARQREIDAILQERLSVERKTQYDREIAASKSRNEQLAVEIRFNKEADASAQARIKTLMATIEAMPQQLQNTKEYADLTRLLAIAESDHLTLVNKVKDAEKELNQLRRDEFSKTMKQQIQEMKDIDDALLEAVDAAGPIRIPVAKIEFDPDAVEVKMEKVPEMEVKPVINEKDAEQFYTEFTETLREFEPALQAFAQITSEIFGAVIDANREATAEQIDMLNAQKSKELADKELTEAQKAAIEEKYAKKVHQLKLRQFEQEKAAKIAEVAMNGALALTKLLTTTPPTIGPAPNPAYYSGLALIIAQTAIQAGVIASQKPPAFAKGTKGSEVTPAGMKLVGEEGPELIWTPGKEKVITAPDTAKILAAYNIPSLPQINDIGNNAIAMAMPAGIDIDQLAKAIGKEFSRNPRTVINIDKNGLSVYEMSRNRKVELLNNLYRA